MKKVAIALGLLLLLTGCKQDDVIQIKGSGSLYIEEGSQNMKKAAPFIVEGKFVKKKRTVSLPNKDQANLYAFQVTKPIKGKVNGTIEILLGTSHYVEMPTNQGLVKMQAPIPTFREPKLNKDVLLFLKEQPDGRYTLAFHPYQIHFKNNRAILDVPESLITQFKAQTGQTIQLFSEGVKLDHDDITGKSKEEIIALFSS
jgi:hypothetical protein